MMKFSTLKLNVNTYHPDSLKSEYSSFELSGESGLVQAPDRCVENILNFARSYKVADSKSTGKIEMQMNYGDTLIHLLKST